MTNILETITSAVSNKTGRAGLVLAKHSPEILLGVGIGGMVVSTVLACRATLKVDEVLAPTKADLAKIHAAKEDYPEEKYSTANFQHDLALSYVHGGWELAKLYGPAFTLGLLSIGSVLGSHGLLTKRNLAVMAAYKVVEEGFSDYRDKVKDQYGEDVDRKFRYGITEKTVTETTVVDGKKKKTKSKVEMYDLEGFSAYAVMFDENSHNFQKDRDYNLLFLRSQESYANDRLQARGHLFLNEVYEMLGFEHTAAGAVVGWVLDKDNDGDQFVSFDNIYGAPDSAEEESYLNGTVDARIPLDFNVDGLMWDLI